MDHHLFVWSTASFIETRLKESINYASLEKTVGFSYRHIRETFKECTGFSLSQYILMRRIANSAFEIVHTGKNLTDIAAEYMFDSYDTFTRAFRRHTNYVPSDFRKRCCRVGRKRLLMGMYAPTIYLDKETLSFTPDFSEDEKIMNRIDKNDTSCILYGVPKVAYTFEECTPFCAALKACLNYMGQVIDYAYIMAATGASFRLRWNLDYWDGGNVDIRNIYEDRNEAFCRAFQAAGRTYQILERKNATKENFIQFIKSEIDEGRPVLALGIIGPPEACVITGYKENGLTLLGWNCFQENQEFAKDVTLDESGYFVTNTWWENEGTLAVMSIGEKQMELVSAKELLQNAVDIMTKSRISFLAEDGRTTLEYAGGQEAYDIWAKRVADDNEFNQTALLPILFERIMCQGDAQVMIGEGRSYAACFLEWITKEHEGVSELGKEAAKYFRLEAECAFWMNEPKGGFMQDEATTRKFAQPEVRKQIVPLILKAKEYDALACGRMKEMIRLL
ncbi:MAG: DNA-binding protein AraC-type [Herbinix sp.]|jgi:AraC-like DNA-binding protein|nr:DNA-binding protein AraC-type [Herbinix sp.]